MEKFRKYKIEKILDIQLSKMQPFDIVNVTVKELFRANDKLIIFGFKVGFGLASALIIIGLFVDRFIG